MTTGTVITFYSYKGGVGRSFTLANVAVLLARWGYRVLAVDWDLEAPGLHHYFRSVMPDEPEGGVIDLAHDVLAGATEPRSHAVRLGVEGHTLALLAAGRDDGSYMARMQRIDWENLYERGFATFLERCRDQWIEDYDFVLIDSRTGISDIAGICTAQLPDRLAVLFTANEQNLKDVVDVVQRADAARDRLPYDRPRHLVLPILSRLDNRVEYEQAEKWQRRCAEVVAPLFGNWLVKGVSEELALRHLTVPYISHWSFGEQLSVLQEKVPSAVSARLAELAGRLPEDLRLATRAAFAIEDGARLPLYQDRVHWAAIRMDRDPRTVRRRVDEAINHLAELAADAPRDRSGGWRTTELHAVLTLDRPRPEVIERHTVVADRDGLRELPLTPPRPLDRPDLDVRVLYGGTLVDRPTPTLALPTPVPGGRSHDFAVRYRPPAAHVSYLVHVPQHPCDLLDLRVRFGPTPPRVWALHGAHPHDVTDRTDPGDPHPVDQAGEIHLRFRDITPGLAYGVRWDPPGD